MRKEQGKLVEGLKVVEWELVIAPRLTVMAASEVLKLLVLFDMLGALAVLEVLGGQKRVQEG